MLDIWCRRIKGEFITRGNAIWVSYKQDDDLKEPALTCVNMHVEELKTFLFLLFFCFALLCFALTCFAFLRLSLTYFDLLWLALTCFDLFWLALTDFDLLWLALTYFDLLWLVLTCVDLRWLALTCFDLLWLALTCCYLLLLVLTCFDLFWLVLTCFDLFWLVLTLKLTSVNLLPRFDCLFSQILTTGFKYKNNLKLQCHNIWRVNLGCEHAQNMCSWHAVCKTTTCVLFLLILDDINHSMHKRIGFSLFQCDKNVYINWRKFNICLCGGWDILSRLIQHSSTIFISNTRIATVKIILLTSTLTE